MFIVLATSGKNGSVDYASVHLFENESDALAFCLKNNSGPKKYWTKAEVIKEGLQVELYQPEE